MSALDDLLQEIEDPSALGWRAETYSIERARALSPGERARYVKKLMEKARIGDSLAIVSLGHLPVLEAVPMLLAASKEAVPWAQTARRALVLLGSGYEVLDAIVRDALHSPAPTGRIAAMMDLKKLGGPKVMEAFDKGLDDPDSTVRMLAWEGLVGCFDLEPYMRNPEGKLAKGTMMELMHDFLAVDIPALNRMGAAGVREIIEKVIGGESPESIGLAYTPDPAPEVSRRVSLATVHDDMPYPVDELLNLSGLPRQRAEALIASRALVEDPRVTDALVKLEATWTIPILEEMSRSTKLSNEMRMNLLRAIRDLKAS